MRNDLLPIRLSVDQVSRELGFGAVEALDSGSRGTGEYACLENFPMLTKTRRGLDIQTYAVIVRTSHLRPS